MKGSEPDLICGREYQFQTLIDQRLGSLRDGNSPGSELAATGRYRVCVGVLDRLFRERRGLEPIMHVVGADEPIHVVRFVVHTACAHVRGLPQLIHCVQRGQHALNF